MKVILIVYRMSENVQVQIESPIEIWENGGGLH